MLYVIREAVYLYKDYPDAFARLRARAMACDFSWARSAGEYLHIYSTVTGQPWPPAEEPVRTEEVRPGRRNPLPRKRPPLWKRRSPHLTNLLRSRPREAAQSSAEPAAEEAAPAAPEKKPAARKRTAAKKPAAKKTAAKSGRRTPAKKETKPKKGTAGKQEPAE